MQVRHDSIGVCSTLFISYQQLPTFQIISVVWATLILLLRISGFHWGIQGFQHHIPSYIISSIQPVHQNHTFAAGWRCPLAQLCAVNLLHVASAGEVKTIIAFVSRLATVSHVRRHDGKTIRDLWHWWAVTCWNNLLSNTWIKRKQRILGQNQHFRTSRAGVNTEYFCW